MYQQPGLIEEEWDLNGDAEAVYWKEGTVGVQTGEEMTVEMEGGS